MSGHRPYVTLARNRERRRLGPTKLVTMIAVFFMTVMAVTLNTFAGSESAAADVSNNSIGHVFLDIRNVSGDTLRSQYLTFLQSLRAAAGHEFRDGVQQTQTDTTNRLIRVETNDLRGSDPPRQRRMSLWLTPNNPYVVSFQNQNALSWDLNDNAPRLDRTMESIQLVAGTGPENGSNLANRQQYQGRLPFWGNYISLSHAAQRGRDAVPSSFQQLINSVNNYRISDFAYRVTQNPRTAALVIPPVGFLRSFRDVQLLMAKTARRRSALRVRPRPIAPQTCSPSGPSAHARRSRGTLVWTESSCWLLVDGSTELIGQPPAATRGRSTQEPSAANRLRRCWSKTARRI